MKKLFIIIAVCGFVLVLGTAGTSDLEAETGVQLLTDAEFYTSFAAGLGMLVSGFIGSKLCRSRRHTKPPYRATQRTTRADHTHDTQKTA